jgi:hypothetical protein
MQFKFVHKQVCLYLSECNVLIDHVHDIDICVAEDRRVCKQRFYVSNITKQVHSRVNIENLAIHKSSRKRDERGDMKKEKERSEKVDEERERESNVTNLRT